MEAWTRCRWLTVPLLLAALASGCARTEAKVTPDAPALDMPVPPPRVIATTNAEVPQPVGAPPELPSGIDGLNRDEPVRAATVPSRPTAQTAKPADQPKPDAVAVDAVKPPDEPRATQISSPLQTTPTQREGEVEAGIRADITRASTNLNRVDYQKLSPDARSQYDLAKSYVLQAEDALKAKNLAFAKSLAEKAATIAAQLGR